MRSLAQHPLGVVHELAGGGEHGVHPVAVQQLVEAAHPEPGRGDLGVEVVLELARGAAVAPDVLPQRLVAPALLVELGAREQHPFRYRMCPHLLGDGVQSAADDLQRDGVELRRLPCKGAGRCCRPACARIASSGVVRGTPEPWCQPRSGTSSTFSAGRSSGSPYPPPHGP